MAGIAVERSIRRRAPMWSVAASGITAAVVAALGTAAVAAIPVSQIREEGSARAIPNSYLVILKDTSTSPASVDAAASGLVRRHGGSVRQTWGAAVLGFEFAGTPRQATSLAGDRAVAYVEQNQTFTVDTTQTAATWGLDRVDQRHPPLTGTYTYSTTAATVHAYILDTGIRFTHSDFGGRASSGFDFVDNDAVAADCNGHGTHVAGTVGGAKYGVAKRVSLVAVRVLNCSGSGTTAGVVSGVNWVTRHAIHPAVANLSLGGAASTTMDNAVRASISSGVSYAVAAGNGAANACGVSPARVGAAITVGATSRTDARPSFSNYGSCLDIFAPGVSITSDWSSGDTATSTASGTSMAAPHVTGAAALILAKHPGFTPAQVVAALIAAATIGAVTNPGVGSPNRLLFVS